MGIEADVKELATDMGRAVGTAGHEAARRYIVDRLGSIGVEPYLPQGFGAGYEGDAFYDLGRSMYPEEDLDDVSQRGTQDFCNLLAVLPGEDTSLTPVLLGAHYDAVEGTSGADDNAAAVAVLLEVSASLKREQLRRSVIFAFFDAEEPPHFLLPSMGSIRFFEDQRLGVGGPAFCHGDGKQRGVGRGSSRLPGGTRHTGSAYAERICRGYERPPHLPAQRSPLPLPQLRDLAALPPAHRYYRQAQLP